MVTASHHTIQSSAAKLTDGHLADQWQPAATHVIERLGVGSQRVHVLVEPAGFCLLQVGNQVPQAGDPVAQQHRGQHEADEDLELALQGDAQPGKHARKAHHLRGGEGAGSQRCEVGWQAGKANPNSCVHKVTKKTTSAECILALSPELRALHWSHLKQA